MRTELYKDLCARLKTIEAIKHIDLWNRNVEFIEQEDCWERPAVFIEFGPITWQPLTGGHTHRGSSYVKLHIVTDWNGSASVNSETQDEVLQAFDLSEQIQSVLLGIEGKKYHALELSETLTNHDHEDIVENIDVYKLRCYREI